jgi:predicted permease
MRGLPRDVGYALRMLARKPAFAAAVVLTLALGIGPNTAIFSVVNSVLLRPLPYEDPEQLVLIRIDLSGLEQHPGIAMAEVTDFREQSQTLQELGSVTREFTTSLTAEGNMEAVLGAAVTPNLFPLLGIEPVVGRQFAPEEGTPDQEPAVILSHGLWQRRYGGDAGIVGDTIEINGNAVQVVGVMPERFRLLLGPGTSLSPDVELWFPLVLRDNRGFWAYRAIGRIAPDVTVAHAEAEIQTVGARIVEQYPDIYANAGIRFYLHPLHGDLVQNVRVPIYALLGAVVLVLLIACTNAASLLIARNKAREKEFAVRYSLGARRGEIVNQVMTESVILALLAGGLGLVLGAVGLKAILAFQPGNLPRMDEIGLDPAVLGFTIAVSFLASLAFGIIPAIQASRPEAREALRDRTSSSGVLRSGPRRILVVSEVAFSLMLLIGAGLLIRTFNSLRKVDLGFQPESVITFQAPLEFQRFSSAEERWEVYRQARERIIALPGVRSAGGISLLPLGNQNMMASYSYGDIPNTDWNGLSADYRFVTPGYFETMGISLQAGRAFDDYDNNEIRAVAIIDETLAREAWPDEDPVGQMLRIGLGTELEGDSSEVEIVGVAKHSRIIDVRRVVRPQIFLPYRLGPAPDLNMAVHADVDPVGLMPAIRNVLEELGTGRPIHSILGMEENVGAAMGGARFTLILMAILAAIALMLSTIGLYSVIAFIVRQRTHELGIRMALGARRSHVVLSNLREGLMLVLIGIPIGLVGAFFTTRFMGSILYGVRATDLITFGGVALLFVVVALLASYLPAWQASRVDPAVALRQD